MGFLLIFWREAGAWEMYLKQIGVKNFFLSPAGQEPMEGCLGTGEDGVV